MVKTKYRVVSVCPNCELGDLSFSITGKIRDKMIGMIDEVSEEMEVNCPICGKRHKTKVIEVTEEN